MTNEQISMEEALARLGRDPLALKALMWKRPWDDVLTLSGLSEEQQQAVMRLCAAIEEGHRAGGSPESTPRVPALPGEVPYDAPEATERVGLRARAGDWLTGNTVFRGAGEGQGVRYDEDRR